MLDKDNPDTQTHVQEKGQMGIGCKSIAAPHERTLHAPHCLPSHAELPACRRANWTAYAGCLHATRGTRHTAKTLSALVCIQQLEKGGGLAPPRKGGSGERGLCLCKLVA